MRTRNRILGGISALVLAVGGLVTTAPAASAFPEVTGSLVNNGDGTVTATYFMSTADDIGIQFCNPSFTATDLSQCSVFTSAYAISENAALMPASPAPIVAGMTAIHKVLGLPREPLPAGYYTLVLSYEVSGTEYFVAGLQNVRIGDVGGIPMWMQATGRHHSTDTCQTGWSPSWQHWAEFITGGWVCMRMVPAYG